MKKRFEYLIERLRADIAAADEQAERALLERFLGYDGDGDWEMGDGIWARSYYAKVTLGLGFVVSVGGTMGGVKVSEHVNLEWDGMRVVGRLSAAEK